MNNVGKKIVTLRNRENITQDELARRVGVTRQAISKWERGEGLPDLYNITLLAKALGVTVDDLVQSESQSEYYNTSDNDVNLNNVGGFIKKLLYKAKTTTNSDLAKKIRKNLLLGGGIGLAVGIIMIVSGFVSFTSGAFNSVNEMGNFPIQEPTLFNPLPSMLLFLLGGVVSSISVYVLYAGFGIAIAEVTTNFLDTRRKCPKCGDEIDDDERMCSNCGYNLEENPDHRCKCGKANSPEDKFCRECGEKL